MGVYIFFFCHTQAKAHFHVTQRRKDLHATSSELLGISNVPFTCMCQRHLSHMCVRACVHTFTHASISQWMWKICVHAFCTHVYEKLVARRSFSFITTSLWATASEQENCTLCTTQKINVFTVAWKLFEKKSTAVLSFNFAMHIFLSKSVITECFLYISNSLEWSRQERVYDCFLYILWWYRWPDFWFSRFWARNNCSLQNAKIWNFTRVKRSLSIVNFERRIASKPGPPAG